MNCTKKGLKGSGYCVNGKRGMSKIFFQKDEKKIWQLGKKVRPLSNFSEKKRSGERNLIAHGKQQELIDILKLANRAKALDF